MDFASLLRARRSRRAIRPASLREIANLLRFAHGPHDVRVIDGLDRSWRPSHSAGGLHAVQILMVPLRGEARAFRYTPAGDAIEWLRVGDPDRLQKFRSHLNTLLPDARGTAFSLVGDLGLSGAVYRRSESLLWRDAGALLQTLHLCAASLRLAFCPFGIHGDAVLAGVFGSDCPSTLRAMGGAVVGRPA